MQQPQRSKKNLAQMDFLDYTMSQHQKALAARKGTAGTHSSFRIHLAADSGYWNRNERVPMSHSSFNNKKNIPKTAWDTIWYHDLWRNSFWMLALCPYYTHHHADFCIPEFQRQAVEMCWFESADSQMPPSDIASWIKPLYPLLNFKCFTG
jgi:hypothetical protein